MLPTARDACPARPRTASHATVCGPCTALQDGCAALPSFYIHNARDRFVKLNQVLKCLLNEDTNKIGVVQQRPLPRFDFAASRADRQCPEELACFDELIDETIEALKEMKMQAYKAPMYTPDVFAYARTSTVRAQSGPRGRTCLSTSASA
jgi:hypothetical protein|eukprot:6274379-Prymnesium_polylepis.1